MNNLLTIFFGIFLSTTVYGQVDSLKLRKLEIKTHKIDSISTETKEIKKITVDSVKVQIYDLGDKIKTINFFSNSQLIINYYFENNELISIKTEEKSPILTDLSSFTEFYFENEKLIGENYYRTVRSCLGISAATDYELYGYNPLFTKEFLIEFNKKTLRKILE